MNGPQNNSYDDTTSNGGESDYIVQIRRNKAREMELMKQLRELEDCKEQQFQEQPPQTTLLYSKTSDTSMSTTVTVMREWLDEKEYENKCLKDQLQKFQTALHQKDIELAVLRERLANQEKLMEKEVKMRKDNISKEVIDVAQLESKSWNQDDNDNSKSSISSASSQGLNFKYDSTGKRDESAIMNIATNPNPSNLHDNDRNLEGLYGQYDASSKDVHENHPTTQQHFFPSLGQSEIKQALTRGKSDSTSSDSRDTFDANSRRWKYHHENVSGLEVSNEPQSIVKPNLSNVEEFTHGPDNQSLDYANDEDNIFSLGNSSLGPTVATSTIYEALRVVKDYRLSDPYGDSGKYTGVILLSTGMPHGAGRLEYDDIGRTYDGEWRHGRWNGLGIATLSNGGTYEGEHQSDQRHGRGKFVWSDGRVYVGEFHLDQINGMGNMVWPDGARYIGEFYNGKRQGKGQYFSPDGGYYNGNWKHGRYDGFGECHWNSGGNYIGEWRKGKAHGDGMETLPDGQIRHNGLWIDDNPVL